MGMELIVRRFWVWSLERLRRGEMGIELGLGGGEGCKWRELVKVLDNSCSLSDIILLSLYIVRWY